MFDSVPSRLDISVEIREHVDIKDGKHTVRKIICGSHPAKRSAKAPYPTEMFGIVDRSSNQPDIGHYLARIVEAGNGKAWHCELIKQ